MYKKKWKKTQNLGQSLVMESYPCCELTYKEVHKAATHQYDLVEIFREIVQNKKDEDYRGDELEQDTGAGDHLTHDEPCWNGESKNKRTMNHAKKEKIK